MAPPHDPTATQKRVFRLLTPMTAMLMSSTTIFIVTLLVGLWAAYDLGTALLRFGFMSIGLVIMFAIGWLGRYHAKTVLSYTGIGCAFWAAGLSIAYGLRFNTNSGAVASGLMVLLPLAASGVWWQWMRRQWLLVWTGSSALALSSIVFLLTFERTAWIGLGIGLGGAGYLYWRLSIMASTRSAMCRAIDWSLGVSFVGGLALYGLLFLMSTMDRMMGNSSIASAWLERVALWRESLAIAHEYYFTGSGLGMTAMIYSTYVLSIHTPYWHHAHNLYLQLSLEQGVPGLLAFLSMIGIVLGIAVTTYRHSGPYSRWFCLAAVTALLASLGYGFLDAELYATSTVTVLFTPAGFVLALYWAQRSQQQRATQAPAFHFAPSAVGGAGIVPVVALVVLCIGIGPSEKFYTNLAVLTQTKAELSHYHWPLWSLQDALRRTKAVDLSVAVGYYQQVLALNQHSPTAHQRLGQIALSQGDYQVALVHLTEAYQMEPTRNSLGRLLGEVYAVTGNVDQAALLWQAVNLKQAEINDRLWWYSSLNAKQEVRWIKEALAKIRL